MLKLKLERAATLVDCLAGERQRWEQTVKVLDLKYTFLPGDCLLATAFVSYTGPFVSAYRDDLIVMWHKLVGCVIVCVKTTNFRISDVHLGNSHFGRL